MEIVRCKNGHSYDPSVTPECPECARLEGKTVPLETQAERREWAPEGTQAAEPIGRTLPVHALGGDGGAGETVPVKRGHWASEAFYRDAADGERDGRTMPVETVEDASVLTPVVGWMICIEGPERGKDYRIHADNNFIGRAESMDICIRSDSTISRENHAIIAYDTRERVYYFAPGSGRGIVRLNGKAVLMMTQLEPYDRIEIGRSILLFVPLCGEKFTWEELEH